MTAQVGETDLDTALRLLASMSVHLEDMVRDAPIVAEKLRTVYARNSENNIIPGLSHLNFGSANSPKLATQLAAFKKSFDSVLHETQRAHKALSTPG